MAALCLAPRVAIEAANGGRAVGDGEGAADCEAAVDGDAELTGEVAAGGERTADRDAEPADDDARWVAGADVTEAG
jgi:hypothetical protein